MEIVTQALFRVFGNIVREIVCPEDPLLLRVCGKNESPLGVEMAGQRKFFICFKVGMCSTCIRPPRGKPAAKERAAQFHPRV